MIVVDALELRKPGRWDSRKFGGWDGIGRVGGPQSLLRFLVADALITENAAGTPGP